VRFGSPITPAKSPEGTADRYEHHTALLKAAVVEMWHALDREPPRR
jgi:hypothetical protein